MRNAAIIAAYIKIHKLKPTIADRRELLQTLAPKGLPVTKHWLTAGTPKAAKRQPHAGYDTACDLG
ncbi:hypothetical protein AU467_02445 [Mesorhizobium loti]|uniref:Uncharacterized protein n=1 Tax=Rhizobium loti TaxID=381 RepID=A0A101KUI1_RHILI|nr:hypothetical protein AU467_02445 [Mesorhizobium loti]